MHNMHNSVHHTEQQNRPSYHLLELARLKTCVQNIVVAVVPLLDLLFCYKIIEAHTFSILKMAKTNENRHHINADGGQFFNSNF